MFIIQSKMLLNCCYLAGCQHLPQWQRKSREKIKFVVGQHKLLRVNCKVHGKNTQKDTQANMDTWFDLTSRSDTHAMYELNMNIFIASHFLGIKNLIEFRNLFFYLSAESHRHPFCLSLVQRKGSNFTLQILSHSRNENSYQKQ